jgi:hypothetical protein
VRESGCRALKGKVTIGSCFRGIEENVTIFAIPVETDIFGLKTIRTSAAIEAHGVIVLVGAIVGV